MLRRSLSRRIGQWQILASTSNTRDIGSFVWEKPMESQNRFFPSVFRTSYRQFSTNDHSDDGNDPTDPSSSTKSDSSEKDRSKPGPQPRRTWLRPPKPVDETDADNIESLAGTAKPQPTAHSPSTDQNEDEDQESRKRSWLRPPSSRSSNRRQPSTSDSVGPEMLQAARSAAKHVHEKDAAKRSEMLKGLIGRLKQQDRDTFDSVSKAALDELKADTVNLKETLEDLKVDETNTANRAIDLRQARRGVAVIRREIFERALKVGRSESEARAIAERAMSIASAEVDRRFSYEQRPSQAQKKAEKEEQVKARDEKEAEFFDEAQGMAEQILFNLDRNRVDSGAGWTMKTGPDVEADPNLVPNIFGGKPLGIFNKENARVLYVAKNWKKWDDEKTRLTNMSLGPRNAFEEMIEWTNQGKLWSYPIDNECQLGDEAEVPFYDHIFLERHLKRLEIPDTGPVAHFMHLVCVGLSKNPHMTVKKKLEHLEWFGTYFAEQAPAIARMINLEKSVEAELAARKMTTDSIEQ